eukprot:CFRG7962T1
MGGPPVRSDDSPDVCTDILRSRGSEKSPPSLSSVNKHIGNNEQYCPSLLPSAPNEISSPACENGLAHAVATAILHVKGDPRAPKDDKKNMMKTTRQVHNSDISGKNNMPRSITNMKVKKRRNSKTSYVSASSIEQSPEYPHKPMDTDYNHAHPQTQANASTTAKRKHSAGGARLGSTDSTGHTRSTDSHIYSLSANDNVSGKKGKSLECSRQNMINKEETHNSESMQINEQSVYPRSPPPAPSTQPPTSKNSNTYSKGNADEVQSHTPRRREGLSRKVKRQASHIDDCEERDSPSDMEEEVKVFEVIGDRATEGYETMTTSVRVSQTNLPRKLDGDMVCDCSYDKDEDDIDAACGSGCLNRIVMIECDSMLCPVGHRCQNQNFQRGLQWPLEVFETERKGKGLRALESIASGMFVIEYVGEIITKREFDARFIEYNEKKIEHFYFMSLSADEVIDATMKGSSSRFFNHSCDPNCITQKWHVNGSVRIGIFTIRPVGVNEELTFDYQMQRVGDYNQVCHCGAAKCRGWLGATKKLRRVHSKGKSYELAEHDEVEQDEMSMLFSTIDKSNALAFVRALLSAQTNPVEERIKLLGYLKPKELKMSIILALLNVRLLMCLRLFLIHAADVPGQDVESKLEEEKVTDVTTRKAVDTRSQVATLSIPSKSNEHGEGVDRSTSPSSSITESNNVANEPINNNHISTATQTYPVTMPSQTLRYTTDMSNVIEGRAHVDIDVKPHISTTAAIHARSVDGIVSDQPTETISGLAHINGECTKDTAGASDSEVHSVSEFTDTRDSIVAKSNITSPTVCEIKEKLTITTNTNASASASDVVSTDVGDEGVDVGEENMLTDNDSKVEYNIIKTRKVDAQTQTLDDDGRALEKAVMSGEDNTITSNDIDKREMLTRQLQKQVLTILSNVELDNRNRVDDSNIQPEVEKLENSPDETISHLARSLVRTWSSLEVVYKIPKKIKPKDSVQKRYKREHDDNTRAHSYNTDITNDARRRYSNGSITSKGNEAGGSTSSYKSVGRMTSTGRKSGLTASSIMVNSAWSKASKYYNPHVAHRAQGFNNNYWVYQNRTATFPQSGAFSDQANLFTTVPSVPTLQPVAIEPVQPQKECLPPEWASAIDAHKRTYYYHINTRVVQWEKPEWPEEPLSGKQMVINDDELLSVERTNSLDNAIPSASTIKVSPDADNSILRTSTEKQLLSLEHREGAETYDDKKVEVKKSFRSQISNTVIATLSQYNKPSCKRGRITNKEDFKHLARKITHMVLERHDRKEDYVATIRVHEKLEKYIHKFMARQEGTYNRKKLLQGNLDA